MAPDAPGYPLLKHTGEGNDAEKTDMGAGDSSELHRRYSRFRPADQYAGQRDGGQRVGALVRTRPAGLIDASQRPFDWPDLFTFNCALASKVPWRYADSHQA